MSIIIILGVLFLLWCDRFFWHILDDDIDEEPIDQQTYLQNE